MHTLLTLPVKGRATDQTPVASALNDKCAHWLIISAPLVSQQSRLHPAEGASFPAGMYPEVSLGSGGLALTGCSQNIPWELRLGVRILLRPQDHADA